MFRVFYKKYVDGKLITDTKEDLTMLELGEYLNNKKDFTELKIYELNDNMMYQRVLQYKNGELVRNKENVKMPVKNSMPIGTLLQTVFQANQTRKENPGQLLYDLLTGEDITKPKLTVVDGGKDDEIKK
ncbi:hypothetical protein COF68_05135 [Bacillus toyonensis]|uniref:hypothetical protein n=1 Tax=Bacillus toyonensis TaxID=155322 RepID=UPI000BFDC383|nr:hypothetical protein [Bacillus toyonensis]PHE64230.1 hypothetical protein COF68_05135 [Bacillus toyonensis]